LPLTAHIRRDITRPPAWPPPADRAALAAAVHYCRLRDPIGHVVHTILAATYLFLLPLATSPKEVASGLLLLWTLIQLRHTWSCYTALVRDRLVWLLVAWAAWHGLCLLWSPDPAAGWDELQAFRVMVAPLALWPVLDRAPWLVGALLAGVFAQNLVQLGQGLEVLGLAARANDRLPGLIHPIQTGAFCAAAMCWHIGALLSRPMAPGRRGWFLAGVSGVGLAAAAGGLVFSGSRGPWISAAIAVPLGLAVTSLRRPSARRPALALALIGLVSLVAVWLAARDFVTMRVDQAVADVQAAASGDYESDVGRRIRRWSAAWRLFVDSPVTGTGGGGYATSIEELGYERLAESDHHAHSFYMHELATAGSPGALLLLAIIVLTLRRAIRDLPNHLYTDGTLFALISWLIGAQFDCYQLAGTMFGLFTFIVALTLPHGLASLQRPATPALARP
jgi:O-antigen ligase